MSIVELTLSPEVAATIPTWAPPKGYTLRAYESSDKPEWLELLILCGPPDIWSAEMLDYQLNTRGYKECSWLIIDNHTQKIVASAHGGAEDDNPELGTIAGIATHPKHRRRGLAFGVCATVISILMMRGYHRIGLGTGNTNLPAHGLYEKLGFKRGKR